MTEEISSVQKKCKHCQASIDVKAKKCQHCGSDFRNWFVRHPVWTVILALIVLPSFITAVVNGSKSSSTTGSDSSDLSVAAAQNAALLNNLTIVTSKIVTNSIGTPEWHVTVKNTGEKIVDAYTISADLFDNFGDPVGKFNSRSGNTFDGLSQNTIKPGGSDDASYNLAVHDHATKVQDPRISKIHFTDGTSAVAEGY